MKRRHFIKTASISIGAALLHSPNKLFAEETGEAEMSYPDSVSAIVNDRPVNLDGKGSRWELNNTVLKLNKKKSSLEIEIEASGVSLSEIKLHWKVPSKANALLYNDHWERTY